MTEPFRGMSDDPGSPENSDPEATSPELAEEAAEEAKAAQDAAADMSAEDLDAELAEVLANSSANQDLDSDGEASSLDAQLAERTEDLQRMTAEYANYRRRTERERSGIVTTAKASVVEKFIPILDDLDLAAQHGDLEEGPLKAFADKFQNIITAQGLAPFGEPGEEFDPEIHEAVQDLSQGDEKVLGTVLRKGYKVGDKVVRTAMVIIADLS